MLSGTSKHSKGVEVKICLIIDDYLPDSIKIGAKMMHELGLEFVKRGHDVMVITPHAEVDSGYSIVELDGVKICYFRSGTVKNVGKVKRAINETLLSHNAWKSCKNYFKKNPHDLIIYYSPSIFWGALVNKLKKSWGASSYLILRDFFPQWVVDNGLLKERSIITRYFRYFENLSYQAADTIAIQSPKNLEWFGSAVQTEKKLDLLYNWAANEPVAIKEKYYLKKYGIEDKVVFFYGGNIGHAQDMLNIVRLAKNLIDEKQAHFVLLGKGDEVELVRAAIEDYQLDNMTLLPPVSQDEFKLMLAEFDIGLFSLNKDHTTHNFPGKVLGYMVQEKPILGSVNPDNDLKPVVENANAGFVSVNGEDDILKENALKLIRDEVLRQQMGKAAKQLLHDLFSVESAVDKILNSRK